MEFEKIREQVKQDIQCSRYLHRAKKSGYVCPYCESGTGPDGTGAVVYYESTNTFFCHKCKTTGDVIDAYMYDAGLDTSDGRAHREAVLELGATIGLYPDDDTGRKSSEPTKGQTPPKNDLNGPQIDLSTKRDNSTPEQSKAVRNDSGEPSGPKKNIKGLFRDDFKKWEADFSKTDYLKSQGITDDTARRFHVGYDADKNAVVYPYSMEFEYYLKRRADKKDKWYCKPKAEIAGPEPLYNPMALYSGKPCFVCEGPIDALSIAQAGGDACAVCGSGERGLFDRLDARPAEAPLILWFDNDAPNPKTGKCEGQEAQRKLAAALTQRGVAFIEADYNISYYGLEHGDPNDLLQADPVQFADDIRDNIERAEQLQAYGPDVGAFLQTIFTDRYKPVATGIKGLDKFLHGGFVRQTLVLLSSKPGAGKTILSSMILESMARQGIPCIYLNLEMSKEQMLARSISRILYLDYATKLNALQILQGYRRTPEEKELIKQAARKYADEIGPYMTYNPLEVSDLDTILKYLEDTATAAEKEGKPAPCVCIDYLHIITSSRREDAGEIIKRAVQSFKEYAAKHNTIVLAVDAQSRAANKSKSADVAAGRDTSALEYSGDLIMQLKSGDDMDSKKGDPDLITLYVTKSRFTWFDVDSGLSFQKHGGQSYFEQLGEWNNVPLCDKTPFDDDTDAAEPDDDTGADEKKKVKYSV